VPSNQVVQAAWLSASMDVMVIIGPPDFSWTTAPILNSIGVMKRPLLIAIEVSDGSYPSPDRMVKIHCAAVDLDQKSG
jgi:hypothetical protein